MVNTIPAELKTNGYLRYSGLFSSGELHSLDESCHKLIGGWDAGARSDGRFWSCPDSNGDSVLYRIHAIETLLPEAVAVLQSTSLRSVCTSLLGTSWKPSAFALCYKAPKVGMPVPWHRDPIVTPPSCIFNLSIYLDDSGPTNGCLEVLPGSHLDDTPVPSNGERPPGAVPVCAVAGDVIVHDVRVLHGSAMNPSHQRRRALVIEIQKTP